MLAIGDLNARVELRSDGDCAQAASVALGEWATYKEEAELAPGEDEWDLGTGGGEGEAVEDDLGPGAGVLKPDASSCSATG